ncbi:uncharacterized protein [Typha angustifolia]|uniref:uncharacterized protein isoform X3 n=1 Tax=Typha angustifolia TaxID=59011 RepID=UPI003C2DC0D4
MTAAMTTTSSWGERAAGSPSEIPSKLKQLRQLKEVIFHGDPMLLPRFVPRLAELKADKASPVRKLVAEMIGDIGVKHMELLPETIPCLISFLNDETPAVARQAITSGTYLFRRVLEKGLYSSEIDDSLKLSWEWMLKFKSSVLAIAVQPSCNGVKLLAIKFVEAMVLLYTPDPNISSDPPNENNDGSEFNILWLRGGHPLLNMGDLAMEASQSLGLLLEQLRLPQVKSLGTSMTIVLINSLSAIAQKRPSFYGRILPALLCLDPASSIIRVRIPGAHHALKNAFVGFLKCTHASAEPWRARLLEALKAIDAGELAEQTAELSKSSGGQSFSTEEALPTRDNNISLQACEEASSDHGRKRHMIEEISDVLEDDAVSGKRIRKTITLGRESVNGTIQSTPDSVGVPSVSSVAFRDGNSEAVHQLVSMFGALAAQGDKAAGSLEILSSSISSDLLAEVVMANMQHLPSACPREDGVEECIAGRGYSSGLVGDSLPPLQPSALTSDNITLSSSFPLIASLLKKIYQSDGEQVLSNAEATLVTSVAGAGTGIQAVSVSFNASNLLVSAVEEDSKSALPLDLETSESKIPGLACTSLLDEIQESSEASHTSNSKWQETSTVPNVSLVSTLPSDVTSTDYLATHPSEAQSPRLTVSDASQAPSSASVVVNSQYVLPKLHVTNINLSDEDKDFLQKEAFVRIINADKQVAVSAGSHARFPLLAHLGVEFPLALDAWELLQKHVLSDYMNHEGHELTLRLLYRLYRETEQDQDFFSSRTAMSVYENFLLTVAEALRDKFPASDKSLGRLLGDAPYLPEGILKLLQGLCSPESREKYDKDLQSGDRVTQGLSAVWGLILQRPSNRDRCLLIALQSAVHPVEEVRMKAIRLVANKLFPMASISEKIEAFASEKLESILNVIPAMELADVGGSALGVQKKLLQEGDLEKSNDGSEHTSDSQLAKSTISSSIAEAQRCMSLYFALCTKKHSLLRQIFAIYRSIPEAAKQAVHRHIPILIRTIGFSSELLGIISDPPDGSEGLIMQVLQTLTDGANPSQDLISSVKKLYSKLKDVEILIPILTFLSKDEILPVFPNLVKLPLDKFQVALSCMLQGSAQSGPCLTLSEVLIAIHRIDPEKEGIPLKKVIDACSVCFEQKVFSQQVLAMALNQLVEQTPLPLLFMRTVIQAIGVFPALVDFVMEIMSRLVSKQIWKYPKLWVGFLKCCIQTKPQSYSVLLQLPAPQLENALNRNPQLKPSLVDHASQPNIRTTLPRSTLVVLGLLQDSQASGQAQTSQSQVADTSSSAADVATEVTQESTAIS